MVPRDNTVRRGFEAEDHFFDILDHYRVLYPSWLIKVKPSSPLLDVRGIDGFAYVSRYFLFWRRIPLQLKSNRRDIDKEISPDKPVYVHCRHDTDPGRVMRNLVRALDRARHLDFSQYIRSVEKPKATDQEKRFCKEIARRRKRYKAKPRRPP